MKRQLIEKEIKCINDCLVMAKVGLNRRNIRHTKIMLEDALKSINEIERLSENETVVLVGSVMSSGSCND